MSSKKILLTVVAIFLIIASINMGGNKEWFDQKILSLTEDIYEQDSFGIEYRKSLRLGDSYKFANDLRNTLYKLKGDSNILLLIPTEKYAKKMHIEVIIPEPVILYFYSGLKAAYPTSKNVYQCNYAITLRNSMAYITKLDSKRTIDSILNEYNSEPPAQ